MRSIEIKELSRWLSIKAHGLGDIKCLDANRIKIDSRKIRQGDIFMPITGDKFDGHDFIEQAVDSGAAAVFCEHRYYEANKSRLMDKPLILIEDSLLALQRMASMIIEESSAEVVAVTGSTGKTTSKDFIAGVLEMKYHVAKTKGNYNNHIGLPLTVLGADEHTEIFVLEMGMNHFGEIEELVKIAKPRIAVITNIGTSHIEFLGSQEGILKAKMEIVSQFKSDNLLIVNGYDPLLREVSKEETSYQKTIYGDEKDCDYQISEVHHDDFYRHSYVITGESGEIKIELGIPGRHNVMNSAAAVIIGELYGISPEEIRKAIRNYQGEKMRLTIIESEKGFTVINDAYNASIDSIRSSLEMIKHFKAARKFVFLGDMLEMGHYAIEGHRLVGDDIDLEDTDFFLSIGTMARHIGERLAERGFDSKRIRHFDTFDAAADFINAHISKEDVLLIKGSRGMAMESILKKI